MAANPYELRASRFDSVQRLYVSKDTARKGVAPESVTVDLARVNVKELRAGVLGRWAAYETAPFDTNGSGIRFYPGGVSVWSGFPGSGKTTLLRQLVCHLLQRKRKVFLASLEEDPRDLLWRLMCTAAGGSSPTEHQCQWFLDAFESQLRIWNVLGSSTSADLLATISELKSEHAIIDSLMALDISGYDWEAQRLFAKSLVGTARISNTHIHLVAHPRKPIAADQTPDVHDVAGSADLGRLVDNVLFVRRRNDEPASATATRMQIMVRKQRHFTGACPSFEGFYHRTLMQYSHAQFPEGAVRYLPDHAYET